MDKQMSMEDVKEPLKNTSPEVQRIIQRVWKAEKAKLYMKNPRYITEDILKIIEEEIR
jgi:hypothetical protein